MEKYVPFFKKVSHPAIHPRVAYSILRVCGQPKFVHLAKSVPPAALTTAASNFDHMVFECFQSIFGAVPSEYEASVRSPCGAALLPFTRLAPLMYEESVARLNNPDICPVNAIDKLKSMLEPPTTPFDKVRSTSASGNYADLWMSSFNTSCVSFAPQEYIYAMRLRCGLPIFNCDVCTCGDASARASHHLSCREQEGITMTTRHNLVVQAIAKTCATFGLDTQKEPANLCSSLRPDLIIRSGVRPPVIDVSIVDPTCPSHIAKASEVPGSSAYFCAQKKIDKYDAAITAQNCQFFPVVFEAYGHADALVLSFVEYTAKQIPPSLRPSFKRTLLVAMSSALQVGNAQLLLKAQSRLARVKFAWHWPIG